MNTRALISGREGIQIGREGIDLRRTQQYAAFLPPKYQFHYTSVSFRRKGDGRYHHGGCGGTLWCIQRGLNAIFEFAHGF